jgi:hypothetical protein
MPNSFVYRRVTVEIAKGTPHGRDRERFGLSSRSSSSTHRRDSHSHRDKDRDKPPTTVKHGYKVRVLNLSSRVTWQVSGSYSLKTAWS